MVDPPSIQHLFVALTSAVDVVLVSTDWEGASLGNEQVWCSANRLLVELSGVGVALQFGAVGVVWPCVDLVFSLFVEHHRGFDGARVDFCEGGDGDGGGGRAVELDVVVRGAVLGVSMVAFDAQTEGLVDGYDAGEVGGPGPGGEWGGL